MFIHAVLFEVQPSQLKFYRKDSLMWASYTKKAKGFIAYFTLRRLGYKNQYASVYEWKNKPYHDRFMKKYHDWLVSQSRAKVKVLGYYNLKEMDCLR